jgi:hypothetical protein
MAEHDLAEAPSSDYVGTLARGPGKTCGSAGESITGDLSLIQTLQYCRIVVPG